MSILKFNDGVVKGLSDIAPFSLSVFSYGVVYGVLSHTVHLNLWQTTAMSFMVFAGASQIVALALIKQGTGFLAIVATTLCINLRQVLYGLSLGPFFRDTEPRKLALLAYGLTDESYGVTISAFMKGAGSAEYFLGAGLGVLLPWVLSSILGFLLSHLLTDPAKWGLDFAFVGAFLGLLAARVDSWLLLFAALASGLAALAVQIHLGTTWSIMAGAFVAFMTGVLSGEK